MQRNLLNEIENLKSQLSRPPLWVDDSQRQQCVGCNQSFSFINRRHHCRKCGDIFDGKCSKRKMPLPKMGYVQPVRVCDDCYLQLKLEAQDEAVKSVHSLSLGQSATNSNNKTKPSVAQQPPTTNFGFLFHNEFFLPSPTPRSAQKKANFYLAVAGLGDDFDMSYLLPKQEEAASVEPSPIGRRKSVEEKEKKKSRSRIPTPPPLMKVEEKPLQVKPRERVTFELNKKSKTPQITLNEIMEGRRKLNQTPSKRKEELAKAAPFENLLLNELKSSLKKRRIFIAGSPNISMANTNTSFVSFVEEKKTEQGEDKENTMLPNEHPNLSFSALFQKEERPKPGLDASCSKKPSPIRISNNSYSNFWT